MTSALQLRPLDRPKTSPITTGQGRRCTGLGFKFQIDARNSRQEKELLYPASECKDVYRHENMLSDENYELKKKRKFLPLLLFVLNVAALAFIEAQ